MVIDKNLASRKIVPIEYIKYYFQKGSYKKIGQLSWVTYTHRLNTVVL